MNPDDENSGSPDENPSLSDIPQGSAPKSTSFKDAFASARSGGEKTFTWNGKSYTTQLANEKPKTVSTQSAQITSKAQEPSFEDRVNAIKEAKGYPVSYAGRIPKDSGGPGGESNIDSSELGRNISNALMATTHLGPGLGRVLAESGMIRSGAKAADKAADIAEKGREAVTNPAAWTGGPKGMKAVQKAEDVARKASTRSARVNKSLSESDTTGGAIGYKRGGNISRRADGIAQKGHTKGRMC